MVTTLANRLYNTMIAIITAYVPSHTCARIWHTCGLAQFDHRQLQEYHSWIAQVESQDQTKYIRILDCKPFINTCYSIGNRFELKNFFLHSSCSMLINQLIDLRKVRAENLKFRTDL